MAAKSFCSVGLALALRAGRWCFVALGMLLTSAMASYAQDAIVERAFLEDKSGSLTWADVQQSQVDQQFQPYEGPLNRGYHPSAVWIRLRLKDGAASQGGLQRTVGIAPWYVLRIQPGYIDEVTLFDPLDANNPPPKVGDRQSIPQSGYHSLNHNFVVPIGTGPRTLWLRLETTSTRLIHVEALTLAQASEKDSLQSLLLGIFLAFLFLFFVWALLHWWQSREPLIGILAAHQLLTFLFGFTILGYMRLLFGEQLPALLIDQFTSFLVLTATATAIAFNRVFIDEFQPPTWFHRVINASLGFIVVLLAALFLGYVRLAMQLNMILLVLAAPVMLLAAIYARAWKIGAGDLQPLISRRFFLGYYAFGFALLSSFSLPSLGLVPSSELTLQANSIYGLLTGVLLLYILQLRAKRLQELNLQGQVKLEATRQQMVQDAQHRKDQAQFMAMLTHELKTPLSVLRMTLGLTNTTDNVRARFDQAIQDMSNVIDRFAWIDKLEEKAVLIHVSGFDALEELDRVLFAHNSLGRIVREADEKDVPLKTDVRLYCTVLNNLVHNALRYSPPDSQVTVSLHRTDSGESPSICIEVANLPGNSGWPDADKVFQKYYRSPGAQRQTGTGLGLYQAKRITHQLGGQLSFEPDAHFIRFVLCLPC